MVTQKIHRKLLRVFARAIAVILIIIGGYIAYNTLTTKKQPAVIAGQPRFSKQLIDSTQQTAAQKQAYSVPPTHPRKIIIDTVGVDAVILPMGVLRDGSLDAPKTAWDVGWYENSALPGAGRGALLLDGHVNDALNQPGIFYKIGSLRNGDEIKIERGDGLIAVYQVAKVDQEPLEKVDMRAIARSINPSREGLNLITCGGTYDYRRQTYNNRVLVYAERTS